MIAHNQHCDVTFTFFIPNTEDLRSKKNTFAVRASYPGHSFSDYFELVAKIHSEPENFCICKKKKWVGPT